MGAGSTACSPSGRRVAAAWSGAACSCNQQARESSACGDGAGTLRFCLRVQAPGFHQFSPSFSICGGGGGGGCPNTSGLPAGVESSSAGSGLRGNRQCWRKTPWRDAKLPSSLRMPHFCQQLRPPTRCAVWSGLSVVGRVSLQVTPPFAFPLVIRRCAAFHNLEALCASPRSPCLNASAPQRPEFDRAPARSMTSKVVSPAKIAGSPQRGSRRGSRLRSLALWLCCFCLAAVACTRCGHTG